MAVERRYILVSAGQFKVISKHITKKKIWYEEWHPSHKKGKWHCDCPGFNVRKNCGHIDWIEECILERNWLTIEFEDELSYEDILK